MPMIQTRRRFLTTLSMASAAGINLPPQVRAAEGALETTTVRLAKIAAICVAPQYVADELLRAEGFTDVRYIDVSPPGLTERVARGQVDFQTDLRRIWLQPSIAVNRSRC